MSKKSIIVDWFSPPLSLLSATLALPLQYAAFISTCTVGVGTSPQFPFPHLSLFSHWFPFALPSHFWPFSTHFCSFSSHFWPFSSHFWPFSTHFCPFSSHFWPFSTHFCPFASHFCPFSTHFCPFSSHFCPFSSHFCVFSAQFRMLELSSQVSRSLQGATPASVRRPPGVLLRRRRSMRLSLSRFLCSGTAYVASVENNRTI